MTDILPTASSTSTPRTHKILTLASWAVFSGSAFWYTFKRPSGHGDYHRIWEQNALHPTPFSLNPLVTSVYWATLFFFQIPYLFSFYSSNSETAAFAASTGPTFATSSLLSALFVHLWVRSHFWLAFAVSLLTFFILFTAYVRFTPRRPNRAIGEVGSDNSLFRNWASGTDAPPLNFRLFQHYAVLAAPFAFSIFAVYWSGAAAFHVHGFFGRVLANVAVWGILGAGMLGLFSYGDWIFTGSLAVLAGSLGLTQLFVHVIAFQWIFAFTIMSILFLASALVAIPSLISRAGAEIDGENRPLLRD